MSRPASAGAGGAPPALADVLQYPLLRAIAERRSRRVARGNSILAPAPLGWSSPNQPEPLTPLEEAILVLCTGLTGRTMHDGPIDMPDGGKELGTPFINVLGRAGSSPDNSQPTHMVMVNDEGTWLIRRRAGEAGAAGAAEPLRDLPVDWSTWAEPDWVRAADQVKYRLSPTRLDFPRQFPYYLGWNKQLSNVPGTTMFLPLVDTTRMYINGILNMSAEPPGQRPLFVDDWSPFTPRTLMDWVAKLASGLGLAPTIPYQPIGGVKRVKGGFVNPDVVIPLGLVRTMLSDHESFFLQQNLMLAAQALGLGAWVHVCTPSPYMLDGGGGKVGPGLGFRMEAPTRKWTRLNRWPPVPASQPNPVGIDGVLEGLTPPYVRNMDEAVDRLLEQKFGPDGAYGNRGVFDRAWRSPETGEAFLTLGDRYPDGSIEYTKEVCNYIWNTYGRFPAHVDAFYLPGTWVQVCHLELEYYERDFDPALYRRQRERGG